MFFIGGVSGVLFGLMVGGLFVDSYGLCLVFFIIVSVFIFCFFVILFCIREKF